ncbi:hypothetical protein D3C79_968920 [compost metagenome]
MAQAEALGMMQPRLAIHTNNGTNSGHNWLGRSAATPSSTRPAARYIHTARTNRKAGPRLASKRALTCATRIKPAALVPNSQP